MVNQHSNQNEREWELVSGSENQDIRKYRAYSWRGFCNLMVDEFISTDIDKDNQNNPKKLLLKNYVWRGRRCASWKLVASFYRDRNPVNSRESILYQHLNSFVYACRGKLAEFGIQIKDLKRDIREGIKNPNHIWSLGQHYYLKTPLLDWCISPFVAAFFAFEEETNAEDFANDGLQQIKEFLNQAKSKEELIKKMKEQAEDRAVIGLKVKEVCTNTHIDYFDPMSSEHSRLINQRGLFTIAKNGECIREIVKKNWKEGNDPWIVKILIPNNKRQEFLRGLNLMNINHMSLFPEITGAAKFCNIGLEGGMDGYAIFHGQVQ